MRRISIVAFILCACLVSVVRAQQPSGRSDFGRHAVRGHRGFSVVAKSSGMASNPSINQRAAAHNVKVWDLGTYTGGTWAEAGGINDFGVLVAQGDTGPDGDNHLFTIRLSGPQGPQWSDLGTMGANEGWFLWPEIADTGMIVGYAATEDGYVHGLAWTKKSGRVDLGSLSDLGYNFSVAERVNKLGTLIVGWSGSSSDNSDSSLPVVWTPALQWKPDGLTAVWKIQALDTSGLAGFHHWMVTGANDFGQLSGIAWDNSDPENDVGVIWNPLANGKGWKIMQLPVSADYPNAEIGSINELGEVVGDVDSSDWSTFSAAHWKPVDRQRKVYQLTLLPNLPGSSNGGFAESISELGDIAGAAYDADWNMLAVRWSAKDPTLVRSLGFPGDWSLAVGVNNQGVAVGTYGGGQCANECVAAVQFR